MSVRRIRSVLGLRSSDKRRRSTAHELTSRAGTASFFDTLERRQLLAFPDTTSAIALTFGAGGVANEVDTIDTTSDEGWYSFTTPTSDFITVLADAATSVGSTLNTRIDLYVESNATPGFAVPARGANNVILSATGNGTTSSGTPTDAWIGFVSEPGQTYFVRVRQEGSTTGAYTLRVDRESGSITPNAVGNIVTTAGSLPRRGADFVYRVSNGSNAAFNAMTFIGAEADPAVLDTRVEIYNDQGTLITVDSNSGVDSNAAAWFKANPNQTYFIRIRSDEFLSGRPASGAYSVRLQSSPVNIPIDPVTRTGTVAAPLVAQARVYSFTPAASGLGIIQGLGVGLNRVDDPAIRLFDSAGNLLAFNDNFAGLNSQITFNLSSSQQYFVLFDGFSATPPVAGKTYRVIIAANATVQPVDGVDDHANVGDWANATPLRFGAPAEVLPTIDWKVTAVGGGRIATAGDTDVFVFVPPKSMLGIYPGEVDPDDPTAWFAGEDSAGNPIELRPSTRLQIFASPGLGFLNTSIQVYRFNPDAVDPTTGNDGFELVYQNNNATLPDQGVSGMYDPAQADPGAIDILSGFLGENVNGITVWAGQPYYIVVSGTGVGAYSLVVQVDAHVETPRQYDYSTFPDPLSPVTPVYPFTRDFEFGDEEEFGGTVFVPPNNGNGDVRFLNAVLNAFPFVVASELSLYQDRIVASDDLEDVFWITEYRQTRLPSLHDFDDVDIYEFTAPYTGTFEIRINTTSLANSHYVEWTDWYSEDFFPDPADPPTDVNGELFFEFYNSLLDSALRIFNNDFEQIAYNDDNVAVNGEFDPNIPSVGTLTPLAGDADNPFANFTFHRRDARVVFNVVAGETYYIQVENGQKYKDGRPQSIVDRELAPESEIDWRAVAGTYELLINGVGNPQNLPGIFSSLADDHPDAISGGRPIFSTVIDINPATGSGTIAGAIETTNDADLFVFRATSTGLATITVARTSAIGNNVVPRVEVYGPDGLPLVEGRATSTGVITVTLPVTNGEQYDVRVFQDSVNTGAYTVTVSNLPYIDDHADRPDFANATPFPLQDFLGGGSLNGSINVPGDTDIFRFEAFTSQDFTFRVTALDFTLDPVLEVYEIAEDPLGNPYLARIGFNDNAPGLGTTAQLTIGVNNPRTSGASGNTYNTYFLVVRGASPALDFGAYRVDIQFPPSDDHADSGEFGLATLIIADAATGAGSESGTIELAGDSDLFVFTAPASGTSTVNITVPISSTLLQRVRIFDSSFTQVASNQDLNPTDVDFDVVRGQVYYILVDASPSAGPNAITGSYTVDLLAPAIDDHPNIGEFDLATLITLVASTGDGGIGGLSFGDSSNPRISPANDTDLFTFVTLASGNVQVTVTPYSSSVVGIGPRVRIFDSAGVLVTGLDVSASTGMEQVTLAIPAAAAGERYYILVSAITPTDFFTVSTGEYAVTLDGPPGVAPPPPDPSIIDFSNPNVATLDSRGDATITSSISVANERDLYTFIAPAKGDIYIQLITPTGSRLSLSLTVLNAANENPSSVVAFDASGLPGVASNITIPRAQVTAGQQFWVIVDGIGVGTGTYTLKIDTAPETYYLYYPEGFSSAKIREVVSISNGGTEAVTYSVTLRYNDGTETIVRSGSIDAGRRGGVTISNGAITAPGVRRGVPYSIVIESSGPLGATLAHYDFDQSTGDSFTDAPNATWSFARVERNPGNVADALTIYNPNPFDVVVTLTAHTTSGTVVLSRTIAADRRGGWNISATDALPVGTFGVTLTSAPADSANQAAFVGIVAGLTHYDIQRGGAYAILGQPGGGANAGAIPSLTQGAGVSSEIAFYNPGFLPTTIVITGRYINASLPTLNRTIDLPAFGTVVLSGETFGLVADQPIGLTYRSNQPIVVMAAEYQRGEANATAAITEVGTRYFFGDAFINRASAGVNYFETLSMFNPAGASTNVTVRLIFTTGEISQFIVPLSAGGFASINLHERPEILNRPTNANFFSIELSAPTQFGVELTHYDLFLGGGYTQSGAPLGLLTPLSRIS